MIKGWWYRYQSRQTNTVVIFFQYYICKFPIFSTKYMIIYHIIYLVYASPHSIVLYKQVLPILGILFRPFGLLARKENLIHTIYFLICWLWIYLMKVISSTLCFNMLSTGINLSSMFSVCAFSAFECAFYSFLYFSRVLLN
jgi:hypothetical protein